MVFENDGDEPEEEFKRVELFVEVEIEKMGSEKPIKAVIYRGYLDTWKLFPSQKGSHNFVDTLFVYELIRLTEISKQLFQKLHELGCEKIHSGSQDIHIDDSLMSNYDTAGWRGRVSLLKFLTIYAVDLKAVIKP